MIGERDSEMAIYVEDREMVSESLEAGCVQAKPQTSFH